jgi:hypothetical protein
MIGRSLRLSALVALVALLSLALLPSCIIWDDGGHHRDDIFYQITWHNNSHHDVDVWVGGERVFWNDGSSWLYAWETLSSETSFAEGTYSVGVYDHWSSALVSSGNIYIGPGNQEFVTLD